MSYCIVFFIYIAYLYWVQCLLSCSTESALWPILPAQIQPKLSTNIIPIEKQNLCDDHLSFIYLFGVLCRFQHCTGHITIGSFVGRENLYIQLVNVLYCKLPTICKQLPTFPHKVRGFEPLTSEVGGECVTTSLRFFNLPQEIGLSDRGPPC